MLREDKSEVAQKWPIGRGQFWMSILTVFLLLEHADNIIPFRMKEGTLVTFRSLEEYPSR